MCILTLRSNSVFQGDEGDDTLIGQNGNVCIEIILYD